MHHSINMFKRATVPLTTIKNARNASILRAPKRQKRIAFGQTLAPVFHEFECTVQLSDGSTYKRRTLAPVEQLRPINDQRNVHLWNPNKPELKTDSGEEGKQMTKFNEKFGFADVDGDMADLLGEDYVETKSGVQIQKKKGDGKKKR